MDRVVPSVGGKQYLFLGHCVFFVRRGSHLVSLKCRVIKRIDSQAGEANQGIIICPLVIIHQRLQQEKSSFHWSS